MAAPYSFFSRHRLRTPSSARSDPAQCRRHKTVRSMVGLSWFLTRSSIQVQAWPVHQTRPNRGVGLRRLGPWDSKTSSSREVSRDSQRLRHWTPDEPVDVSSRKPITPHLGTQFHHCRSQTRRAQVQLLSRQIQHCLSLFDADYSLPLVISIQQKSSLDTQAQLLPRQMADSTLKFSSSYR